MKNILQTLALFIIMLLASFIILFSAKAYINFMCGIIEGLERKINP